VFRRVLRSKMHSSRKGESIVRSLGHMSEEEGEALLCCCRATRRTERKTRVKLRESEQWLTESATVRTRARVRGC